MNKEPDVDLQGNCKRCGGVHFGTGRNCVAVTTVTAASDMSAQALESGALGEASAPAAPPSTLRKLCYVCGGEIAGGMILFSLNEVADRVFLAHANCEKRLGDSPFILAITTQSTDAAPKDQTQAIEEAERVMDKKLTEFGFLMDISEIREIIDAILPILRSRK